MTNRPFIIPVFLPHLGCPHQCIFCNQNAITGVKHSHFSPDKISNIVKSFLKYKKNRRGPVQIAFYGGNFLGLKKEYIKTLLLECTKFVIDKKVDTFRFSTRPDTINKAQLDIIENFSVSTIEIGVQSMDNFVLAKAKRGHTAEDTIKAFELLKERNYITGAQMMVGLPFDDEKKVISTAQKIAALSPSFVRIYPTLVFADSALASWYRKGKYIPMSIEKCVSLVKKIYFIFTKKGIRVIRMGLQASSDLNEKTTLLAGPYHPAFGHMVLSEIFLDTVVSAIKKDKKIYGELLIKVHPQSVSRLQGLKNKNIEILKKKFDLKKIGIIKDEKIGLDSCRIIYPG